MNRREFVKGMAAVLTYFGIPLQDVGLPTVVKDTSWGEVTGAMICDEAGNILALLNPDEKGELSGPIDFSGVATSVKLNKSNGLDIQLTLRNVHHRYVQAGNMVEITEG